MTSDAGPAGDSQLDPRVERTREHVILAAATMLDDEGHRALNFSHLSDRARVTRQTLYRHWPTPADLLRDLALTGPWREPLSTFTLARRNRAPRAALREFLTAVDDALRSPAAREPLALLLADVGRDREATAGWLQLRVDFCAIVNAALPASAPRVEIDDMGTLLAGLLSRTPVVSSLARDGDGDGDPTIALLVAGWWALRTRRTARRAAS